MKILSLNCSQPTFKGYDSTAALYQLKKKEQAKGTEQTVNVNKKLGSSIDIFA